VLLSRQEGRFTPTIARAVTVRRRDRATGAPRVSIRARRNSFRKAPTSTRTKPMPRSATASVIPAWAPGADWWRRTTCGKSPISSRAFKDLAAKKWTWTAT